MVVKKCMLSSNVAWSQNNTKLKSVSCLSYLRMWNSTTSCILPPMYRILCHIPASPYRFRELKMVFHAQLLSNFLHCSRGHSQLSPTHSYSIWPSFIYSSMKLIRYQQYYVLLGTLSLGPLALRFNYWRTHLQGISVISMQKTIEADLRMHTSYVHTTKKDTWLNTTRTAAWCAILLSVSWQFYPN